MLYMENIETPAAVLNRRFGIFQNIFEGVPEENRSLWYRNSVRKILTDEVYIGNTITFKTGVISYKNQRQVCKPKEDWIRMENTHEPIISKPDFELVQQMLKTRIRPTKASSEPYLFAGIAKCPDCGSAIRYNKRVNRGKARTTVTEYLICMRYATLGKDACYGHYINLKDLTQLVVSSIQRLAEQVCNDEQGMLAKLLASGDEETKAKISKCKSERTKLTKRQKQLEAVFLKLYEDRATGQIADNDYQMLYKNFDKEKLEIEIRLNEIGQFLAKTENEQNDVEKWVQLIKKYKDIETIDRYIVNELIETIYIGQSKTVNKVKTQKIEIHYRFVGNVDCIL